MKRKIKKLLIKNERLCENLNRSQKFYYFGLLFSLLAVLWWLTPFNEIFLAGLFSAGLLLTFAVISDILSVYKRIWTTNIGKGFILVVYAGATNLAYALSSQIINEIVKYETVKLVYATNFVAVMLIPLFIVVATFVVFFILFIFGQFYVVLATHAEQLQSSRCLRGIVPKNIEKYPLRTFLVRLLVFPSVLGFYWSIAGNVTTPYTKFIESKTQAFIYYLEAKPYSRCSLKNGDRAISINDKELIVVRKNNSGYSFEPQLCIPKLNTNKHVQPTAESGG